jgi:hypothetical protein
MAVKNGMEYFSCHACTVTTFIDVGRKAFEWHCWNRVGGLHGLHIMHSGVDGRLANKLKRLATKNGWKKLDGLFSYLALCSLIAIYDRNREFNVSLLDSAWGPRYSQ